MNRLIIEKYGENVGVLMEIGNYILTNKKSSFLISQALEMLVKAQAITASQKLNHSLVINIVRASVFLGSKDMASQALKELLLSDKFINLAMQNVGMAGSFILHVIFLYM